MACALPPPGGGGKRGRDTKVSLPLLTPQPFLRTRLPSVARLNARGPQGRLVLQGSTLDGSKAFLSRTLPPCTVWPRTDSAADNAREIQGITASQTLPDARNRAPVTPVSLHISDVSAQRKVWGVKRGQETIGVLSPFALAGGHRLPRPPKAATVHAHFERKSRLQRRTAVSAEGIPSADGKKNLYLSFGRRMFRMIATNAAGTIPEPPKISWIACGACARMDIFAPMP